MGRSVYASATTIQIIADGGGSHGSRNRWWKRELQRVANDTGLVVRVCHLPPGTSKWNKIEHRMFCHITQNWRGVAVELPDRRAMQRGPVAPGAPPKDRRCSRLAHLAVR